MPIHKEVLTQGQLILLPLVKKFTTSFYLVGGTALALQYGHRRSIDFDLFTKKSFENQKILRSIRKSNHINKIHIDEKDQLTLIVDNMKMTFYCYEYPVKHIKKFNDIITMPDPLTIAAMKAFALGRRAKWKDYVDLFFIFKTYNFKQVVDEALTIFGSEFDEKLFREQLAYFKDLDYSEPVEYMPELAVDDSVIKQQLIKISLT